MKKLGLLLTATAMLAFVGCKNEKKETDSLEELTESVEVEEVKEAPKTLSVMMESKSGSNAIGQVVFTEENGVVKMDGNPDDVIKEYIKETL